MLPMTAPGAWEIVPLLEAARTELGGSDRVGSNSTEGAVMRVLLVDDDRDSRLILRTIFEVSGYEVIAAGDGEDALRMVEEHAPDVILMDLEIPETNGWDATRALHDDLDTSHIPIIAVSAHALPEHKARAREAGCVAYLTKPIEPAAVVREVERILGTCALR